jgi:hypothetical protein
MSTICPAVAEESSMSFRASSLLQVTAKPSPAAPKSARGYRDFMIPRVRLTNCHMLARMISLDLFDRLSNIWGGGFRGGFPRVEEGDNIIHHALQSAEFGF